jgi:nucleoside-diphosphate-sugar epimerase
MGQKIAAITGATGFLGSHIVRALADRGFNTRILARRPYQHPVWRDLSPEIVSGDLGDDSAIELLIRDATIVVHAAGVVAARSRQEFFSVNCDGTRQIAQAVSRSSESMRFLLISSIAARLPELSSYAASKRAAEKVATEALHGRNQLTIVRPPAIYGPWDRATLAFFKAASRPVAPKLPDRNGRFALIHVQDAAAAIGQIAVDGNVSGLYTLADRNWRGYSWPEILATLARAIGRKPYYIKLPEFLLKAAANAASLAQAVSRRPIAFTPGKLKELLYPDWSVDPRELPPQSLWMPVYDIDRGFRLTVTWLRSVGWLQQ